jgi:tetratricopeptide (TPR) repeat protein
VGAKADQLAKDFPRSDEAQLTRMSVYRSMGRLDSILAEYTAAAEKETTNALLQLCVAIGHFEARQIGPAQAALDRTLELRPDFVQARHFRVQLLRGDEKRSAEAIKLGEKLRADHPDFVRGLISEMRYLSGQGAPESKLRQLIAHAKSLPVPPPEVFEFEDDLNQRALWYDPATAIPLYDRALAIDPNRVDIATVRAHRLAALGRTPEALAQLEEVVAKAPGYAEGRLLLARMLMDLQRFQESVDLLSVGFRKVRFQDWYGPRARQTRAEAFLRAGRMNEAIEELQHLIFEYAGNRMAVGARQTLLSLYGRKPTDKVKLLPEVPFLAQKGNYCGPASISMALGYWKVALTQDEIAKDLYTGVAGTAPQVMQEYARVKGFRTATFEGNVERWKKLIDAGVPVLWLTMLQRQGGHYILVVGYNDVTRTFYLHNPHRATVTEVSYDNLKDEWPLLPSLVRSIVLVPEASPAVSMLDELQPTTRLRLTKPRVLHRHGLEFVPWALARAASKHAGGAGDVGVADRVARAAGVAAAGALARGYSGCALRPDAGAQPGDRALALQLGGVVAHCDLSLLGDDHLPAAPLPRIAVGDAGLLQAGRIDGDLRDRFCRVGVACANRRQPVAGSASGGGDRDRDGAAAVAAFAHGTCGIAGAAGARNGSLGLDRATLLGVDCGAESRRVVRGATDRDRGAACAGAGLAGARGDCGVAGGAGAVAAVHDRSVRYAGTGGDPAANSKEQ